MSCDCDIPELYKSKLVTTRKKHRCVECGQRIAIAEKAEKVDALYSGYGFQTFYTCLQCYEIIDFIRQEHDDDLLKDLKETLCCHGELYDLLYELVFDDREEENEGLACHYLPDVPWLNPFTKEKLSLKVEAK
jgi:hypothetical protein